MHVWNVPSASSTQVPPFLHGLFFAHHPSGLFEDGPGRPPLDEDGDDDDDDDDDVGDDDDDDDEEDSGVETPAFAASAAAFAFFASSSFFSFSSFSISAIALHFPSTNFSVGSHTQIP